MELADAVCSYTATGSLQSLPDGGELLLCPELVPCLASTVLVVLLGLDTRAGDIAGDHGAVSANRSSSSKAGSSGGKQDSQMQRSRQQASASKAASASTFVSAAPSSQPQASCSSQAARSSSSSISGRLSSGMSLDSLTPLSCGLFSLLGFNQAVLLQNVEGAYSVTRFQLNTTRHKGWQPPDCITAYMAVINHQVSL